MDKKQIVNCTVENCIYNDIEHAKCTLKAITVAPLEPHKAINPDDSMCASFEVEDVL